MRLKVATDRLPRVVLNATMSFLPPEGDPLDQLCKLLTQKQQMLLAVEFNINRNSGDDEQG